MKFFILTCALLISNIAFSDEKVIFRKSTTNVSGSAWNHFRKLCDEKGKICVTRCTAEITQSEDGEKSLSAFIEGKSSSQSYQSLFGINIDVKLNEGDALSDGDSFKGGNYGGFQQSWSYYENILEIKTKSRICSANDGCPIPVSATKRSELSVNPELTEIISVKITSHDLTESLTSLKLYCDFE